MDPIQQTNTPASGQNPEKKVGPIISILVVVLVVIIAALYVFAAKIDRPAVPTDETLAEQIEKQVAPITSTSSDVDVLQADLEAAIDGLDTQNF